MFLQLLHFLISLTSSSRIASQDNNFHFYTQARTQNDEWQVNACDVDKEVSMLSIKILKWTRRRRRESLSASYYEKWCVRMMSYMLNLMRLLISDLDVIRGVTFCVNDVYCCFDWWCWFYVYLHSHTSHSKKKYCLNLFISHLCI